MISQSGKLASAVNKKSDNQYILLLCFIFPAAGITIIEEIKIDPTRVERGEISIKMNKASKQRKKGERKGHTMIADGYIME